MGDALVDPITTNNQQPTKLQRNSTIMDAIGLGSLLVIIILGSAFFLILLAIKVVPQSMVFVVERFGQYTTTLQPGLRFVVPFVYRVSHRVTILERQ